MFFMVLAFFLPLKKLVFIEQQFGEVYFDAVPLVLIENRIQNFDDYEVYGSLDVLSYFTYKILYEELNRKDTEQYLKHLGWLLEISNLREFSTKTRNKLLIEAYESNNYDALILLYCAFNLKENEEVSYYYKNISKSEKLDLDLLNEVVNCQLRQRKQSH